MRFIIVALLALCLVFSAQASRSNLPFLQGKDVAWSRDALRTFPYTAEQKKNLDNLPSNFFTTAEYFTVNAQHNAKLFTLFINAQGQPKQNNKPIILWLQGGPGCSSMLGNFVELGPYKVNKQTLELEVRDHSWAERYNLIFIDNPVHTGFSTADSTYHVTNQEQVAADLYNALTQFFQKYSYLQHNDFYIFGESYAGKYVPSAAYKIVQEGLKINLKGIGIGDGLTDPENQLDQYDTFAYVNGLIDENQRAQVIKMEEAAIAASKAHDWQKAFSYWTQSLGLIQEKSGLQNPYDIRELYNYDNSEVGRFLNSPQVHNLFNVTKHWSECDGPTYQYLTEDIPKSVAYKVKYILEQSPVKVLIYQGNQDLIITLDGSHAWTRKMQWAGQSEFNNADRNIWKVGGNVAGWVRKARNFYHIDIHNAGHLAPMNQPQNLQDMVTRFIEGSL